MLPSKVQLSLLAAQALDSAIDRDLIGSFNPSNPANELKAIGDGFVANAMLAVQSQQLPVRF